MNKIKWNMIDEDLSDYNMNTGIGIRRYTYQAKLSGGFLIRTESHYVRNEDNIIHQSQGLIFVPGVNGNVNWQTFA